MLLRDVLVPLPLPLVLSLLLALLNQLGALLFVRLHAPPLKPTPLVAGAFTLRDVLPALAALEARAHVRPLVSGPPLVLLAVELPWSHGLSLRSFAQEGRSGAKDIASTRRKWCHFHRPWVGLPWYSVDFSRHYCTVFDALQVTLVQYLHLPGGNTRGRGIERNTETLAQADVYMSYFKTNTITHSDDKTETKETVASAL